MAAAYGRSAKHKDRRAAKAQGVDPVLEREQIHRKKRTAVVTADTASPFQTSQVLPPRLWPHRLAPGDGHLHHPLQATRIVAAEAPFQQTAARLCA